MAKPPINIVVTGDKKLDNALKHLEKNTQRKFVRKAMRKSAKDVILPDARKRVPVASGALKKSLKVRAAKRSRRGIGIQVETKDGAFKGEQYYGAMVEFGTKRMPAQPFLRPALYNNDPKIKQLFIDDMNELVREAARVGA